MRVRIIDVSGSPDELARAEQLIEFLRGGAGANEFASDTAEDTPDWRSAVPRDIRDFILTKTSNSSRQMHVMRFVGEVLRWGDTEVEIGSSRRTPDGHTSYLMLRNAGPRRFGAFAYVRPSTGGATFRLRKEEAPESAFVSFRKVQSDNAYQVNCALRAPEAVDAALELARLALDRITREES